MTMHSPMNSKSVSFGIETSRIRIDPYRPCDNDEALRLEAECTQGTRLALTFRRSTFHRRAENFARHHIVTARVDGQLVAIGAVAIKDVLRHGQLEPAAFLFDFRVHPCARRQGLGAHITRALMRWARSASFHYWFRVADAASGYCLRERQGPLDIGSYCYLVLPTSGRVRASPSVATVTGEELHEEFVRVRGDLDLLADPYAEGRATPHRGSYLLQEGANRAGCSTWCNREILAEIVQRLPPHLAMARLIQRRLGGKWLSVPRIPDSGQQLRSLYLYDFFTTDLRLGLKLVQHVLGRARSQDVDYCYLILSGQEAELRAIRHGFFAPFAPILRYRAAARSFRASKPLPSERRPLYIDPRDI